MAERDKRHLLVPTLPKNEPFTLSPSGGGNKRLIFSGNRTQHGLTLKGQFDAATHIQPRHGDVDFQTEGTYITFKSFPGIEMAIESLDPRQRGARPYPELVAVNVVDTEAGPVQIATVYIPDGMKEYFLSRLEKYIGTSTDDKAKNAELVEGIASIQQATVHELWTDSEDEFPTGAGRAWWEVWLRKRDGNELARLATYARQNELRLSPQHLGFGDRTVTLLNASIEELGQALSSLDDIAELRLPHDVAAIIAREPAVEQSDWINDLVGRLTPAPLNAPVACLLDTGVDHTHPLLTASIDASDTHVVDAAWSPRDKRGHGTEMAGIALYGDLGQALVSPMPVALHHRLESVKFLPDPELSGNQEEQKNLYGAITARAVDKPEIQAPQRPRVFSIASSAPRPPKKVQRSDDPGRPTSWSATIDALAAGRAIDDSDPEFTYLDPDQSMGGRLFVVSAGNIRDIVASDDPLDRSDLEPVEDPAQSWNAITVGAFTDLDDMSAAIPDFEGYVPLASRGELAPTSRTSVLFDSRKWPVKPDVVAEGGNVAAEPSGTTVDTPDNLALLTTRRVMPGQGLFTTTRDTSAATSQVSAIAADVMAAYPEFWPETVRALVIHSAEWTGAMRQRFNSQRLREPKIKLLRRYGMGVPDLTRALYSASNALTLISQSTIRPFEHLPGDGNEGRVREMNLHALPWPTEALDDLHHAQVRMRVTLSYFIEPNPSNRGWTGRYLYPSIGLRFSVRRAAESTEEFRKRINKRARSDGEKLSTSESDSEQWFFGTNQQQSAGSLHTDIWTGDAAELARRGVIAVYPVAGWWKHNKKGNRSEAGVKYSLIISIESPEIETDLWTPVYEQISTTVAIET